MDDSEKVGREENSKLPLLFRPDRISASRGLMEVTAVGVA